MKIQIKIVAYYILFTIACLCISYGVNRWFYPFCEEANYLIVTNAVLGIVSTLLFRLIDDKLLQLGFYFLAKLFKLGLSVICAIILLNSNICKKELIYFFTLITYLFYLTFEITILLTNLRPVSRE